MNLAPWLKEGKVGAYPVFDPVSAPAPISFSAPSSQKLAPIYLQDLQKCCETNLKIVLRIINNNTDITVDVVFLGYPRETWVPQGDMGTPGRHGYPGETWVPQGYMGTPGRHWYPGGDMGTPVETKIKQIWNSMDNTGHFS